MIKTTLLSLLLVFSIALKAQNNTPKKALDHTVYPHWNSIKDMQYTQNGQWLSYAIEPAKGDGWLYIFNTETGRKDSICRGSSPQFSPDGSFVAFTIVPQYDTLRAMKLKKVKRSKLPKDSLGIYLLKEDSLIKISKVEDFQLADSLANYVVYTQKSTKRRPSTPKSKGWWIFKKKNEAPAGPKGPVYEGDKVTIYFPLSGEKKKFSNISSYGISQSGSYVTMVKNAKDPEKPHTEILLFNAKDKKSKKILSKEGTVQKLRWSYDEEKMAFLLSEDTMKENKVYGLYLIQIQQADTAILIADTTSKFKSEGYCPSINRSPYFSKDGQKLYFGIAPTPEQEEEDTLLSYEKYSVDVWSWMDGTLQPQQKREVNRDKRKTNLCVYRFDSKSIIQIEDDDYRSMGIGHKGNLNIALLRNVDPYLKIRSWGDFLADYYIVNLFDGSRTVILQGFDGFPRLSADGHFVLFFNKEKQAWFSYDIKARKYTNLTGSLPVVFYNEDHDMPNKANAYGLTGWYKNDKYVVINDRYDLWVIDPTGKHAPQLLTQGYGRKNSIRFNALSLDRDNRYLNDDEEIWLYAFNYSNKQSGFYTINSNITEIATPKEIIMTNHRYNQIRKPKESDMLMWRRMSFTEYPDVFISDMSFKNARQITKANPQQNDYLWGSVELTKWKAYDGTELEGLIYKPENFDSTKKYPMIVYFYERYANNLHNHYVPKPSHSTVNFTEYVSNGYVVFVPDIRYKTGHPAKSAYNCIVSGTEHMTQFPWINSKKMALQGQSWGGYQTAMLVTMTNIYACAEAGAPVSNMTSAYGGIRWSSGMSRAFQYEKTQSRIGYSLWDSTHLYIENSPIFFADKVKTPLLIMHNDKDGAVPWYQGIEYFNALRRLEQPVWMLTYNNDGHNLMKWPNRVDLSIRMKQFFDHYLMDMPMPIWMSQGLPALDKGKVTGYELDE
jgi:dipeptidyl aminopeptidase/acylaminoacyl peptidase